MINATPSLEIHLSQCIIMMIKYIIYCALKYLKLMNRNMRNMHATYHCENDAILQYF